MALFKYLPRSYRIYKFCYPIDYTLENLTLACYVHVNHHVSDQHIIGTPALGYQIFLKSINNFSHLAARIGTVEIVSAEPIRVKTWIHVAITYNGTTFGLYENGEEIDFKVADIRYGGDAQEKWIWLYHNNIGGNGSHIGLNLFNLWDVPLSGSEIKSLSNLNNPADMHTNNIVLADYLDFADNRHVHGTTLPCDVVNAYMVESELSPFSSGLVPYSVVDIDSSS